MSGAVVEMEWEETGPEEDPGARLSSIGWDSLTMNGCSMHVEAYAVHVDASSCQVGDHDWCDEALAGIECMDQGDGHRVTFERNGRSYIVVAYPFCD